jgi:uncharacterized SAM-binding protein YcdF (DUF218 family)
VFLVKKIIAPFLFPVPIIVIVLGIGLIRLWRGQRKTAPRGRNWLTMGFVLLVVLSTRPLPTYLLGELEARYPDFSPEVVTIDPAAIVVLAGGISDDESLDPLQRLSESTLVRLAEGMKLARRYPSARLVVSGGSPFTAVSGASMMAGAAIQLGFDSTRIDLEELSLDTDDQAQAIAGMLGARAFILVTSAYHMPRTMRLFERRGLTPIPAPANRLVKKPSTLHPGAFFPSAINLEHSRIFFRESLGMVWAKVVELMNNE